MSLIRKSKNVSDFRSIALQNLVATAFLSLLPPMATTLSRIFTVDLAMLGFINAIFLLIAGIISIFWAIYADRTGRKKLLLISASIWISSSFLTIFTINITMLFVLQAFGAIGFGGILPISYGLIIDKTIPEKRSYALGILQMCITLGIGFGYLLSGLIIMYLPWYVPFLIVSILGIINLFFLLRIDEPIKGSLEKYFSEDIIFRINIANFKEIGKIKSNYFLILFTFIKSLSVGAINFYFIAMLEMDHGFTPSIATIIMISVFSIMLIGAPLFGKIADEQYQKRRTGKIDTVIFIIIMGSVFYLLGFRLRFDHLELNLVILFIFFILIGAFFMSGDNPIQQSVLSDVDPPQIRSTVYSITYIASYLGQSSGVMLLGYLYLYYDNSFSEGYILICFLLMSSVLFLIPLRKTMLIDLEYLNLKFGKNG